MDEPIITACPTLTNPDAIDSVDELRRELHAANEKILELTLELHEMKGVLDSMGRTLTSIAVPYMQGKPDELIAALDEFVAAYGRARQAAANGRAN